MAIEAVLFDAVGTLIYPDPPVARAYSQISQRYGCSLAEGEIARRFQTAFREQDWDGPTDEATERHRWRSIVEKVFPDLGSALPPLFDDLWEHFGNGANWQLYSDVQATICQLQQSGLVWAIASNFDDRLLKVVRQFEVLRLCRHVFCSAQLGYSKPSVEFYSAIQSQMDLQPSELLMVGDDQSNDFLAPTAAGWHAIHLRREEHDVSKSAIFTLKCLPGHLAEWD